jgi:hypothetical protein
MQPMFFDGVWKEAVELAAAATLQPETSSSTAPRSRRFTARILLPRPDEPCPGHPDG